MRTRTPALWLCAACGDVTWLDVVVRYRQVPTVIGGVVNLERDAVHVQATCPSCEFTSEVEIPE